jgi:tetratricopeptide (TPR) repeat protein
VLSVLCLLLPLRLRADAFDDAVALHQAGKLREALAAYAAVVRAAASDPETAGLALANSCLVHDDLGEFRAALDDCRRALALQRQAGDAAEIPNTLNNLGRAQEALGQTAQAETSYGEALALHHRAGQAEGEAIDLGNLGAAALSTGRYSRALDLYQQASALATAHRDAPWAASQLTVARINHGVVLERVGLRREALDLYRGLLGEGRALAPRQRAALLVSSGVLYRNLGDPVRASDLFRRAIALLGTLGDRAGLSNAYLNLGLALHLNLEERAAAESAFREALRLAEASGDRTEEVLDLFYLGRLLREEGRLAEAQGVFERCLDAARSSDSAEGRWSAHEGLGRIAWARGDAAAALAHFDEALAEIERLRAAVDAPGQRAGYFGDKRSVYAAAIALLAEMERRSPGGGSAERALALVERAKARDLLDRLRTPQRATRPLAARELRARAGGDTLLEYFLTDDRMLLWTVRSGGIRLFDLGARQPLLAAVVAVHRALAHGLEPPAGAVSSLSRALLGSVSPLPRGDAQLHVAADGLLEYLPFELLTDPERPGHPLLEQTTVTYLPSASLIGWHPEPHPGSPSHGAAASDLRFAGVGAPLLPGDESTLAGLLVSRFGLGALPGARRELAEVRRLLGGEGLVLTGGRATEEGVRRAVRRGPRVVHFATHTVIDERAGRGAAILLTPAAGDDGLLEPAEIAALDDRAPLTVLAACRTSLHPDDEGRALSSLTGAFLAAGSRAVLATLWDVGDANTAVFMHRFYSRLARGDRPAAALRHAKLELTGDPRWRRAALWSGYVLIGDAPPVVPSRRPWVWAAVTAALLAGGLWLLAARPSP